MTSIMQVETVRREGKFVRLEPLSKAHVPDLAKVGLEEKIWRYMRYPKVQTVEQLAEWVRKILELQTHGTDLPFAVIHLASGAAIGCTRFLNIDLPNRSFEIGGTWYGLAYQGTLGNTEFKYKML